MGDGLFVHGSVTDAQEARLALAGLIAVHGATLLDVRTGVMHGAGSTALVTGTANTAPMKVSIAPHNWVTSRGSANGPYLGALAAAQLVDIAAAPGAGTRIDVVYEKQQDATPGVPTPDAVSTPPIYGVVQGVVGAGKPSLAAVVGAEELATVAVSAGATRTTDGTVLITNTARQCVARGADIPCRTQAERDAITKFIGLSVKRLDLGGLVQRWTGTVWAEGSDVPVFASNAARDTYYTGNLRAGAKASVGGIEQYYSGTKWKYETTGRVLYTVGAPTTDAGGAYTFPHGLGVTPSSIQVTTTQQASDLLQRIGVVKVLNYDAANIVVGFIRTDTSAYLTNSLLSLDWTATA